MTLREKNPQPTDREKLQFEFFKHITTLSVAAALFEMAILEKIAAPNESWARCGLIAFFIAILCSFMVMGLMSSAFEPTTQDWFRISLEAVAYLSFYGGLVALALSVGLKPEIKRAEQKPAVIQQKESGI